MITTAELSVLPHSEQRRSPRRIVNLAAALREEGASSSTVQVIDVSAGGCRIVVEQPVGVASEIWLKLPGLETKRAYICWAEAHEAGCGFEMPLHPAELESLTAVPPRKPAKPKRLFKLPS